MRRSSMVLALGAGVAVTVLGPGAPAVDPPGKFVEGQAVLVALPVLEPFGLPVDAIPDLDGDGVEDFVVGTLLLNPSTGGVKLYSGASGALIRQLVPSDSLDAFPSALADAGDVDRDGVHDIAVGTAGGSFDSSRGAVRVYSGADGHVIRTVVGEVQEQFGFAVASAGDFDGDGAADLLVGAPRANGSRGRACIVSGADGTRLRTFEAPDPARKFGWSVAMLRDIDGDRRDDVLVGAPAIDFNTVRSAYALSSVTGAVLAVATGAPDSPGFGGRSGSAGDFNGDGIGDFYVEDASAGGTPQNGGPGRYQVYSGNGGALLLQKSGVAAADQVGYGGRSYDFDRDGRSDVIVGAHTGAAADAGSLAIYAGPDGHLQQSFTNTIARERFGYLSRVMGDVNGDGRIDLLATTFNADDPRAYVVAGAVAEGGALVAPGPQHTGVWYDPAHSGEGFVVEMLDGGRVLVYFFSYARGGAQRYLLGVGNIVGRRVVVTDFLTTAGGRLGGRSDPASVVRLDQNQLVLSFDGCDSGWAEYTVDGARGRQRLARLTRVNGLGCDGIRSVASADYGGTWYDPAHSGEGWIVQSAGPDLYVLLWFSYAEDGTQQWFIAAAPYANGSFEAGDLRRPVGGRFGDYFRPDEVVRQAAGALTMAFADCGHATVDFDAAGQQGTVALVRLTSPTALGCAGPP